MTSSDDGAEWRLDFDRTPKGELRLRRSMFRRRGEASRAFAQQHLKRTAGVEALGVLVLRTLAASWQPTEENHVRPPYELAGVRPSPATSLSDAIKNCPDWLRDAFGDALGVPYASHVLLRGGHETDPSKGEPIRVWINPEAIRADEIRVFVAGRRMRSPYELERAAYEIETRWMEARDPNMRAATRRALEALADEYHRARDSSRLAEFIMSVMALLDDDATLLIENGDLPLGGRFQGKETIQRAIRENFASIVEHDIDIHDVVTKSDGLIVLGRDRWLLRGAKESIYANYAQRYTLRNGRLVLIHQFSQRAENV